MAEFELIGKILDAYVNAHPLIGQIPSFITKRRGPLRIIDRDKVLEQPTSTIISEPIKIELNIIRNSKITEYRKILTNSAISFREINTKNFYRMLDETIEASGNVFEVKQEKPFFDVANDMLDSYPIQFDDYGNPKLPQFIAKNPEINERLQKLQPTPEQEFRFKEILERKRTEYFAAKRTRRLS